MAALLALSTIPAQAADPFYDRLLREGELAYGRGDYARAEESLRLACFGLLEEPPVLAECLVHLALAQAEQGKQDAFGRTFYRLAEVEERFEGYSHSRLGLELRAAFESRVVEWIPLEAVERSPGFRRVAQAHIEARLARLSPEERRGALEKRVAEQPDNPRWRLLLADLELSENDSQAALEQLQPLLRSDPSNSEARCLRGEARALRGKCRDALADLAACTNAGDNDRAARAVLSCQVALKRWDEAQSFLLSLSPQVQKQRDIQKLARAVEKARPHNSSSQTTNPGPEAEDEGDKETGPDSRGDSMDSRAPPPPPQRSPRKAGNPEPSATTQTGAAQRAATRLQNVKVLSTGATPSFHIVGDGHFSYSTLFLEGPHRFVMDLAGVTFTASRSTVPVGSGLVQRVRMAQLEPAPDPVSRVVFDLERKAVPRIEKVASGLIVRFGGTGPALTRNDSDRLGRARRLLQQARSASDLQEPLSMARQVADAHPEFQEAQLLAAEIAYRAARWQEAATYFRRAGAPGDDQPTLLFYMAVAFYETGDRRAAAEALRQCLPRLRRTPFVDSYVEKILGPSGS